MSRLSRYLLIGSLSALLFLPFLGRAHLFDWDEINFAESAREMIVTGNYGVVQIGYKPFWEKPPFFIWMQVASMRIFGVNEFAARFPDALTGIITLLLLCYCGRKLSGDPLGTLWVLAYAGSWLPFLYFKSGIIDPVFNLLIFCALWKLGRISSTPVPWRKAAWAGLFLGMAVLTKGPVAILVCILVYGVLLIWKKGRTGIRWNQLLLLAGITALVGCAWFGYIAAVSGWGLIRDFIAYQVRLFSTPDSTHGGPFFYHWYVLFFGCFPASVFLLSWFSRRRNLPERPSGEKDFGIWMGILFWVVLLLFSVVKTKIIHYSSLCYFPLTFLAAMKLKDFLEAGKITRWVLIVLGILGLLIGIAIAGLPLAALHPGWLAAHIADPFGRANLQAKVSWSWTDCLYGLVFLVLLAAGWIALWRRKLRRGLVLILVAQLGVMESVLVTFTPRIEAYTQGAAIRFYQSLQGKDVYVHALGYKSYAQLFYARVMPQPNPLHDQEDWLLHGPIDKPAYFVCKSTSAAHFEAIPGLFRIGGENGFIFLERKP